MLSGVTVMNKEAQLWNEYLILREEIKTADTLNYQILGIVVGAVAVILVAGFGQANLLIRSLVFLCTYVVTVPGYRLLRGNRSRIWRISTYIRVFLEPEPELQHINWESRLDDQRSRAGSETDGLSFSSLVGRNEWFIITLMNTVAALAAIVALSQNAWLSHQKWIASGQAYTPVELITSVVLIVGVLVFNWHRYNRSIHQEKELRRLGPVEKSYYNSWLAIKNNPRTASS